MIVFSALWPQSHPSHSACDLISYFPLFNTTESWQWLMGRWESRTNTTSCCFAVGFVNASVTHTLSLLIASIGHSYLCWLNQLVLVMTNWYYRQTLSCVSFFAIIYHYYSSSFTTNESSINFIHSYTAPILTYLMFLHLQSILHSHNHLLHGYKWHEFMSSSHSRIRL